MPANDHPPVSLRIRLKYPTVEHFIEKYAPNISRGGMFIQSRAPQPVGTQLRFELLLKGGTRLLKGEGRVVWVKEYDASQPTQAHGMGVRFTSLDAASEKMIATVLLHRTDGGQEGEHSPTQELHRLATAVMATEVEEPEQPARPPTALGVSLGGSPQLSEDLTVILADADRQLEEILFDTALSPDRIDEALRSAIAQPRNGAEIAGLEQLLGPVQLQPSGRGGLEQLRHLLGAPPVAEVHPLEVEAPGEVEMPPAELEMPPAELEMPPADNEATTGPDPVAEQASSSEARASSPEGPTAVDITVEPLPAVQDSSADVAAEADFDLDIEAAIEPADPPPRAGGEQLDSSLIEAALHLPADEEETQHFDLSEEDRGDEEVDTDVSDLPSYEEVIFASRPPLARGPDADTQGQAPSPQLIGEDQLPGDSELPADPDLQDQVFETLAQARRLREAGLVAPAGEGAPPETLEVDDFAGLAEALEPAPADYDESVSTEDQDLPSIDDDLLTVVDNADPPPLSELAGDIPSRVSPPDEWEDDEQQSAEKPRRSGIFRRIFRKQ